ncbi:TRAP transporter large permease [Ammoniphilus resinae]|nr:TRAP transporter large permease [Ammoniphilus resinae]
MILFVLFGLFLLNVPIAFAIALTSFVFIMLADTPGTMFIQRVMAGANSFPLLAIPLFILAGSIMNHTSMANKLFGLANAIVGHIRGGLAQVNVLASVMMAGVSGSSIADAAATTKILVPQMVAKGYPKPFSVAVTAASATIGPIIPPSILFVVYGWLAGVSVGKMFIAGAIPGLIVGLYLMITVYILSKRYGYGLSDKMKFSLLNLWNSTKAASWSLFMPIVILGGILTGVFTTTEAAAVAAVYALVVGVVTRELKLEHVPSIMKETIMDTTVIMLIVAAASPFGWILALEQVPQMVLELFTSISSNVYITLFMLNIFFFILGLFMETMAVMIILVPVLMPLVTELGIDPLHFGVIIVINLLIGQLTPPLGMLMFATCSIAGVKIVDFQKAVWPFYIALFVALIVITYLPQLYMWLPDLVIK